MQNFSLKSHVGEDGILRLELPIAAKNADLRVTVSCRLLAELPHKYRNNPPTRFYCSNSRWFWCVI